MANHRISEALHSLGFGHGHKTYMLDDVMKALVDQAGIRPPSDWDSARRFIAAEIMNGWPNIFFSEDGSKVYQAWFPPLNSEDDDPAVRDRRMLERSGADKGQVEAALKHISSASADECTFISAHESEMDTAAYEEEWIYDEQAVIDNCPYWKGQPQKLRGLKPTGDANEDILLSDSIFRNKHMAEQCYYGMMAGLLGKMVECGALLPSDDRELVRVKTEFVAIKSYMETHFPAIHRILWGWEFLGDQVLKGTLTYNGFPVRYKRMVGDKGVGPLTVYHLKMDYQKSPHKSANRPGS